MKSAHFHEILKTRDFWSISMHFVEFLLLFYCSRAIPFVRISKQTLHQSSLECTDDQPSVMIND